MEELSQTKSVVGTIDVLNCMESLISEAEKFLFCIIDRPIHVINARAVEKIQKGVIAKAIFDEHNIEFYQKIPETKGVLEKRVIDKIPVIMLISEKSAVINLMSIDSRGDAVSFHGKDAAFLEWARDLFSFYWEKGKPFHSKQIQQ